LAQEVWRADAVGDEEAKATRGGEPATEELVADLSLDKEMLQENGGLLSDVERVAT
jgi:hypothetical protein